MKIGPKLSDPKTFGDPTPYNIMFGPDKCGYTKRREPQEPFGRWNTSSIFGRFTPKR